MSESNPFAAALTALSVSLAQLDYVGEDCDGVKESMAQAERPIPSPHGTAVQR